MAESDHSPTFYDIDNDESEDERYNFEPEVTELYSPLCRNLQPNSNIATRFKAREPRISNVRRTFCLFVLFDLILSFVVWIIYSQVLGDNNILKQITKYSIKSSMFDTVICSASRFLLLILFYAACHLKNPSVVAITTTLTCAFVLAKAFLFKFSILHNNAVLAYMLMIVTFVLAWVEVWILDFKVLPTEQKSHREDDRALLEEEVDYYSPAGSDDELINVEDQALIAEARSTYNQIINIYFDTREGWKLESGSHLNTGIVHSKVFEGIGKIYRLQGHINCTYKMLFRKLVIYVEQTPKWTKTVLDTKIVQVLDKNCDIIYNIAAEAAGGLVSSRDFVLLRYWRHHNGIFASGSKSIVHEKVPVNVSHIRAETRPAGFVFEQNGMNSCLFTSFVCTDLKGYLPRYLVDQAMATVLINFLDDVKNFVTRDV